jgi:MFS family permease
MIFSFGTSMLAERGWSIASSSSITSMTLWLTALSVPLGGLLADRTSLRSVLMAGLLSFAVMLLIAARSESVVLAFVGLGLVCGLAAGPIMSLPARVLEPATRTLGMGIFFTLFYICVVVGPWIGGYVAKIVGSARASFDVGAIMLVACCAVTFVFQTAANYEQRRRYRDKASSLARRGQSGRKAECETQSPQMQHCKCYDCPGPFRRALRQVPANRELPNAGITIDVYDQARRPIRE